MNQMKLIISIFCCVGSVLAQDDNVGCIAQLNGFFFNLKPLSIPPNVAVPEESQSYTANFKT